MHWLRRLFHQQQPETEVEQSRSVQTLEVLLQDARYGARLMWGNPGFSAIAVFTLLLGIGANTAMFSVVNGVLLSPLPYPNPEQLIALYESKPNFPQGSVSYLNFRDWQKGNSTLSSMAVYRDYSFSLTGKGDAEQLAGLFVSSDFFPMLGVSLTRGRNLRPGEDEIGAAPVALISAPLWERKFGSSPSVLGQSITLSGRNYDIIGVVGSSSGLDIISMSNIGSRAPDVYVPICQWDRTLLSNRGAGLGIRAIGRLKPGTGIEKAQMDLSHVAKNLETAFPVLNRGIGANLVSLHQQILGGVQPFLLLLLGAVGFVLLIACVNVANLLLARSISRTREFGLRVALGASASRLIRQLLTESVILGLVGGAFGLALAMWGMPAMLKLVPTALPHAERVGIDARVLLFTCMVSLFSGLLFGLVPALKISRPDVIARMKEGGFNVSRTSYRTQNAFVIAEVAMALVLLIGAGLMIRSLSQLWKVDPGFDPHNVVTFRVSLPPSLNNAPSEAIRAEFRQIEDHLRSLPVIDAASVSSGTSPLGSDDEQLFWMEGQPKPSNLHDMNWALRYEVGPSYLRSMGIPLLRGRFFSDSDDQHRPQVVVIDEVFAHKFFPNQDATGKRINLIDSNGPNSFAEIVGVVKHIKQWGLDADDKATLRAQLYRPFMQLPDAALNYSLAGTGIVVRLKGKVNGALTSIHKNLQEVSADLVLYNEQSMEQSLSASLAQRRFLMILLSAFGALALALASIGIYGVISYIVGQRTREIGIRMALGAQKNHVLTLVLSQGTRLVLIGVVAGIIAALALTRLMTTLLFGISATDPMTFACVAALLVFVALMACLRPIRRAMAVNPIVTLRSE
jgi:predicted permease